MKVTSTLKVQFCLPVDMNNVSDAKFEVTAAVLLKILAWDFNAITIGKYLLNDRSFFSFRAKYF